MERRKHRSPFRQDAVGLLLDTLRQREQLEAVTLATEDGLLIAGAGPVDLERMGALASTSTGPSLAWGERTLHVERFDLRGSWLYLGTAGGRVGLDALQDLRRVLGSGELAAS